MKLKEIISYLETIVPLNSQENYDNSGLIIGNDNLEINKILICLDSTEEIVEEAIKNECNLIISHHPILFKELKSLTGKNYVEKVLLKCIKNEIALYAIHTNLDNYKYGVNFQIGKKLKLENIKILKPKENNLFKINVFVPLENKNKLSEAMFNAGAGNIGDYKNCSFLSEGLGTFMPILNANPFIGKINKNEHVKEYKIEMITNEYNLLNVINELKINHPYEEPAYDILPLKNTNEYEGSGMIGYLNNEIETYEFLKFIKKEFNCNIIRHTKIVKNKIKKVAICGGSGAFLLKEAIKNKADIFITSDFKYHDFFDAENKIIIADIGHFESEQFTINLLFDILTNKFPNLATRLTEINTNPINYF